MLQERGRDTDVEGEGAAVPDEVNTEVQKQPSAPGHLQHIIDMADGTSSQRTAMNLPPDLIDLRAAFKCE